MNALLRECTRHLQLIADEARRTPRDEWPDLVATGEVMDLMWKRDQLDQIDDTDGLKRLDELLRQCAEVFAGTITLEAARTHSGWWWMLAAN